MKKRMWGFILAALIVFLQVPVSEMIVYAEESTKGFTQLDTVEEINDLEINYEDLLPSGVSVEIGTSVMLTVNDAELNNLESWTSNWSAYYYDEEGVQTPIDETYYDTSLNGTFILHEDFSLENGMEENDEVIVSCTIQSGDVTLTSIETYLYWCNKWKPVFCNFTEISILSERYFNKTGKMLNFVTQNNCEVEIYNITSDNDCVDITVTEEEQWKVSFEKPGKVSLTFSYAIEGKEYEDIYEINILNESWTAYLVEGNGIDANNVLLGKEQEFKVLLLCTYMDNGKTYTVIDDREYEYEWNVAENFFNLKSEGNRATVEVTDSLYEDVVTTGQIWVNVLKDGKTIAGAWKEYHIEEQYVATIFEPVTVQAGDILYADDLAYKASLFSTDNPEGEETQAKFKTYQYSDIDNNFYTKDNSGHLIIINDFEWPEGKESITTTVCIEVEYDWSITTQETRFYVPLIIEKSCEHDWVEDESRREPPRCTEAGLKVFVCSLCDREKYENTDPDGVSHYFPEGYRVDVEPTETTTGIKSRHCDNIECDARTDITVIPMLGNAYKAADDILVEEELTEEEISYLNEIVGSIFATGNENNASAVLDNGMTIDDVAALDMLYVSNNENVGETIVSGDEAFADTKVEGAALAVAEYLFNKDEILFPKLNIEHVTTVVDNTELQEAVNNGEAFVLDITLSVVDEYDKVVAEDVQPSSPIRISMPIPEEWVEREFVLCHYPDGSSEPEIIEYTVENGIITFTVTGFSYYSLEGELKEDITTKEEQTKEDDIAKEEITDKNSDSKEEPRTGDNSLIGLYMGICLFSMAGIFFVISKKSKNV